MTAKKKTANRWKPRKLPTLSAIAVLSSLLWAGRPDFFESKISIQAFFTGLLALSGFLFSARTFITFKLNETIYTNEDHQKRVEQWQKDEAYKKGLYDPLHKLDCRLGVVSWLCLAGIAVIVIYAIVPIPSDYPLLDRVVYGIVFGYFTFFTIEFILAVQSLNTNIRTIIHFWESEYESARKERDSTSS